MTKTRLVLGLALAGVLAVACSSSTAPVTATIAGACGPLPVNIASTFTLSGPCDLGSLGTFAIDAGLQINIGQACGNTNVGITADFAQNGTVIHSGFTGGANLPCPLDGGTMADITQPIPISGTFTYAGGTGAYSDASGTAFADGGVTPNFSGEGAALNVSFTLAGSLTY
jgi:hypothetical protein